MLNFTIDLIDHRLPVHEAVEWARISLTKAADNAITSVEAGFDAGVLDRLSAIGYRFSREPAVVGAVQAVVIDPGTGMIYGEADPRRNGAVIGLPRRRVGGTP
jgi:gamma-glutamyltranspeptidase/glutathione hydrolase